MKGEIYQNPDRELYIFSKHGSIRSGAEPFAAVREDGQLVDFVRTDDFNGFDPDGFQFLQGLFERLFRVQVFAYADFHTVIPFG